MDNMSVNIGSADRGNPKYSKKNLSQFYFVDLKSHINWLEI